MRTKWALMVSLAVLSILPTSVLADGLPKGTWKMNATGFQGDLIITSVTAGNVTGTMFGNEIIGFYNSASHRIMFMRKSTPSDPTTYQIYTGYLFKTNETTQYVLAGTFESFAGTGATSVRNLFGWYATNP